MNSTFARRLFVVTALEIAGVLCAVVVGGALFAFNSYVGMIKGDLASTSSQLLGALEASGGRADGKAAAQLAGARFLRSDVIVVIFDGGRRYDVYRPKRSDALPIVRVTRRGTALPETNVAGPFAQPIVGLATALGLQPVRSRVDNLDIVVRESDNALVHSSQAYLVPLLLALALAWAIGFSIARAVTHQVLQPLLEVTEALERFAAGDLSPQHIVADRHHQLGRLAIAYNGAIAQMERAFAERERANAAMRQFIADAGHQLRTPLTVVRGFIAILRKGELRTPEDRARILETMNRQSQIMGSLIEKLMLLDRWADDSSQVPHEPIDIGQLVDDVVGPIAEANPARVVRIEAGTGDLVAIDPIDLTHALTNLVDNALKYTAGAIDVSVRRSARRVVVEVSDQGPGLSAEEVGHAFDRFFRGARRDVDGSGLGLAIARRAVERAGGTLSLESEPTRGSRFTISLPAAASRGQSPVKPPPSPVLR